MPESIDKLTPLRAWGPAFIAALSDTPNVSHAARLAGVSRQAAYQARESDPAFAAAWDDAVAASVDDLEGRVFDATRTIDNPTAATLAMFLLKAHRPEKYREKVQAEHSGGVKVVIEYSDGDPAEAAQAPFGPGADPEVVGEV